MNPSDLDFITASPSPGASFENPPPKATKTIMVMAGENEEKKGDDGEGLNKIVKSSGEKKGK
jgi:hypothetical protein